MESKIQELIGKSPKTELHLHIEGSLEPELMFKLAKKNNISLKYKSVEEIKKAYQFNNLQSFLDIYYEGANVLKTQEDFFELAWAYLLKCKEDNIVHTEIFFDPQTHTDRGIKFETCFLGLKKAFDKAKNELGISSHFIMCFLRHLSEKEAFHTLDQALEFKDDIIGIGLDSSEIGHPPSKFKTVFDKARKQGFKTVAHAGEEGGPDYIWEALNLLQVERIDHGVRCLEDEKLVAYLRDKQVPLTVCPYSNIKLKVFDKLEQHNLKKLLENDLVATVNSDDPAYFGGYLNENLIGTAQALDLDEKQIRTLIDNSFKASFLSDQEKMNWIKQ